VAVNKTRSAYGSTPDQSKSFELLTDANDCAEDQQKETAEPDRLGKAALIFEFLCFVVSNLHQD